MMRIAFTLALLCSCSLAVGCGPGAGEEDESSGWSAVIGLPEALSYGAVWSFAEDDVWVTADGGRVLRFDGNSWSETALGTPEMMLDIWAFATDDVWMVGGQTLVRYDGADFTVTDLSAENDGIVGLTALWASGPDDVWAGGSQSTVARFNGTSWSRTIAAGTENKAIWGSGPDDVYVVGDFDVAHWDGASFETVELDTFGSVESVYGFAADDVWLSSGETELTHWDGSSWETVEGKGVWGPTELWGSAPDDIWGVGKFGSINHYDGNEWDEVDRQAIDSPYLRVFHDVHGSGPDDVWTVGSQAGDGGLIPLVWRYGG